MADLCVCGHDFDDWREHTYDPTEDRYVCMHPAPGASGWRTRSPLSSFRGSMRWTREDARDALVQLGFTPTTATWAIDAGREGARRCLDGARVAAREGFPRAAYEWLTAARILRAVRP